LSSEIEVAGLVTKLSVDDAQLEQDMASLTRQMNVVKSEFQKSSAGLDQFGKGTEGLKNKSNALTKQLELQGVRVAKLQQEHAKAVKEKGADAKETQNLEIRLNKAAAEYNKIHGELQRTNIELAKQSSTLHQVGTALDSAGTKMQKYGKQMEAAGKGLARNVTAPIVAGAVAITKFGADFEKAMVGSTAIMSDVSDEMREKMERTARDVAKTTRFSATQAAESYFYLASAGMDAAQSMAALPKVAAFAQAGNFNMALATDLLTDAQSALGLTVSDVTENMENMARVSDVLVKANTLANATVQQFSESLTNKAAAGLRTVNKEVEEGVAVLAAYADRGLKGAAAGEALNIMLRDIPRAYEKNKKAFKDYNIEVVDQQGNMLHLADIVENLGGKINDLSDAETAGMLDTLGLTRGVGDAIKQLVGAEDAIRRYEKELRNAGGTTQEIADKQIKNLWDQLGLLKDRAIDSALTMYETLGPAIEKVIIPMFERGIEKVESLVNWFASLDPAMQRMVLNVVAGAAAAGPLLILTGKMSIGISALAKVAGGAAKMIAAKTAATAAMGTATATAAGSTGLLGGALGGLVSPAGLAVVALAGIAYGGFKLWQHMRQDAIPTVRQFGDEVSDSTKQAVNGFFRLYDETDTTLKKLKWTSGTVTEDMAGTITKNYTEMSDQIIAGLEKSRVDGVASLEKMFAQSKDINEEEQAAMLDALNKGYDDRIATIEEQKARILEIFNSASEERRELTRAEQQEIAIIQRQMKDTAIFALTETELEQKAILERMKADADNITARQAADVVKHSVDQQKKAIEAAETQYHESVKQFVFMRDELKTLSADQADKLIQEAKRQRDEAVGHAQDMHRLVVDEAQRQAEKHIALVDWETGEILSKWQIFMQKFNRVMSGGREFNPGTGFYETIPAMAAPAPKPPSPYVWGGEFDTGGTVPGPIGAPRVIMAHGGETYLPTHKPDFKLSQEVDLTGTLTVEIVNDEGKIIGKAVAAVKDILRQEGRR
jgi:TP901 family phage tail tape measure protein